MKFVTTAVAALAIIGSLATAASAQEGMRSRTVITHGDSHRGRVVKKVVIRHDRGMHRGWDHSAHRGAMVRKKVIIER